MTHENTAPRRHDPAYRPLSLREREQIRDVKELGAEFLELLRDLEMENGGKGDNEYLTQSRLRLEEAVMWAVKHIAR